eukprot:767324-Hanusia_phi.AAC.1
MGATIGKRITRKRNMQRREKVRREDDRKRGEDDDLERERRGRERIRNKKKDSEVIVNETISFLAPPSHVHGGRFDIPTSLSLSSPIFASDTDAVWQDCQRECGCPLPKVQ